MPKELLNFISDHISSSFAKSWSAGFIAELLFLKDTVKADNVGKIHRYKVSLRRH